MDFLVNPVSQVTQATEVLPGPQDSDHKAKQERRVSRASRVDLDLLVPPVLKVNQA